MFHRSAAWIRGCAWDAVNNCTLQSVVSVATDLQFYSESIELQAELPTRAEQKQFRKTKKKGETV